MARSEGPGWSSRGFGGVPQPVRIVVSSRLDLPLTGRLARSAQQVPVWICHGRDAGADLCSAWSGLGARLIACPQSAGQMDMAGVLQALGQQGLTRIFCEGGAALSASLLLTDLVDEIVGFTAGLVLGAEGWPALGASAVSDTHLTLSPVCPV